MSLNLQMTKAVWLSALPKGVNKLVLLAMCHHYNDTQQMSWPSVGRLALMCGMSERTIQNHLRVLQRVGILVPRLVRTGFSTRYAIALGSLSLIDFTRVGTPETGLSAYYEPAEPVDNLPTTPAESAPPITEIGTTPPQISTDTPAESAPELSLTLLSTVKRTAAPASPVSAPVLVDDVNPEVMASFAAICKSKRRPPLTADDIADISQQAALAGMTLEQALVHCIHPDRKWARFDASWLQSAPRSNHATTVPMPAQALWKPAVCKRAAPEVAAAGRQRLSLIRATPPAPPVPASGIQVGTTGPGWAHTIVNKHRQGQHVSHAALKDACIALRITPASLNAARLH